MQVKKYSVETPYPVGVVHLYSCEIGGRLVLFDTGPHTEESRKLLEENLDLSRLEYVFVTHCHPDHYGQIKFLEDKGAKIIISKYDTFKFERLDECGAVMRDIYRELGAPDSEIELAHATLWKFQESVPFAQNYLVLEESGDLLDSLGVSYRRCPGHSQSDIVYLLDNYAVSGDVMLREIFTAPLLEVNYDMQKGRFCNYKAYCSTITTLKEISGREFLPSHRDYIDSFEEQVAFYVKKLIERTVAVAIPLKSGKSVYETFVTIFGGQFDSHPFGKYIKISEIIFMEDFLKNPGLLADSLITNGIYDKVKKEFERINSL